MLKHTLKKIRSFEFGAKKPIVEKVYLHIGLQKTGTTELQLTFRENYDLLLKNGILYPKNGLSKHQDWRGRETTGGHKYAKLDQIVKEVRKNLSQLEDPPETIFFSNENILSPSQYIGNEKSWRADFSWALGILKQIGKEVCVVVTLRDSKEYFKSWYKEVVTGGFLFETRLPLEAYKWALGGPLDWQSCRKEILSFPDVKLIEVYGDVPFRGMTEKICEMLDVKQLLKISEEKRKASSHDFLLAECITINRYAEEESWTKDKIHNEYKLAFQRIDNGKVSNEILLLDQQIQAQLLEIDSF